MSELVQVGLPSGHVVWARVAVPPGGPVDVRRGDHGMAFPLDGLREAIEGVAASLHESLAGFRPTQVGVEFSVEIEVRAGKAIAVIADVGGRTSVKVSLTWDTASDTK